MRRICTITVVCLFSVLVFCAKSHASDVGADFAPSSVPRIVVLAVANRDFFAKSKLNGRDWLYDVERMGGNMIGVVVIEPLGVEMTYVFDVVSGKKILSSSAIRGKSEREARISESIRVSDAVNLAKRWRVKNWD